MAQIAEEALVAVTGSVVSDAVTAVVEYGANAEISATAIDHGLVSEDGVTITGSRSTTNKLAWQNAQIVRALVTESGLQIKFVLIQTNDVNGKLYYGTDKNAVTGGYHWDLSKTGGLRSYDIRAIDEARGKTTRYYVPSAEVVEVDEIKLASGEFIAYGLTLQCYTKVVAGESCNAVVWEGEYVTPVEGE